MNITNALEIALNHLDCLTAGQHPFIKEGRSALMKHEVRAIESDLAMAVTEKRYMEMTLLPQLESEREANARLTAELEAMRTELHDLIETNNVLADALGELEIKFGSGLRVSVARYGSMLRFNTLGSKNATLILDDGVEI